MNESRAEQLREDIDRRIERLHLLRDALDLLEAIHTELTTGDRQVSSQTRTRLDNFVGYDDSE